MRASLCIATLGLTAIAPAQNWYIPNNSPTTGVCTVIPFASIVGSNFAQCKYQTRFTAADLGGVANLITGLGFASCGTGRAHYDLMEVVLDHIPATQSWSTTFASNLTPAAVTVLNVANHTWHQTTNAWNEIGLQNTFAWNGVDDVVLQITIVNGVAPLAGFHRDARQRVYWNGATGTPPATGTLATGAGKVEVSMLMARTSSHGDGCVGSNGVPTMSFTGAPQQGTTFDLTLANGVPNGIGLMIAGTTNGFPFPIDLGPFGAPSCYAYTDLTFTSLLVLDGVGAGSFPLPIPAALVGFRFFGQFAVLDLPANQFGFTTSNYLNVLTGN